MRQYHADLYLPDTPLRLVEFFEEELELATEYLGFHRVRKLSIQYGNMRSGKAWTDKPSTGFVALNPERPAQLVLRKTQASNTHEVVLMGNIVRIWSDSTVYYRHPLYHTHTDAPPAIEETHDTGERALRNVSINRNASNS